ncbi:NADH:ubiquinone oxidoreductase subunit N [Oligella sp. HMSC05A10]|uniref:NADH-quinone oxidoreductase subunit NuoN n=1 Tax=Oligella TaxID=90243 RepID=UPI0008A269D4|nr:MULTISPECIES: NADH-quinone oxidoreductase subunit NuoN [Oligella]MDK6202714.1 NADH-quinone oxidoreductase subunit NuoN [Oligella urethralis]OFS88811.1 NADH:ubiquinone oxidoreductase subunit N [Oligella sp. HMSC05A10]SUA54402.1 NADH-quinone oxidoreductase subunit N [Oligella urethralis]
MIENQFNFAMALPEILLCLLAMGVLLIDAFARSKDSVLSYYSSLLSLLLVLVVVLFQWSSGVEGTTFYQMYIADALSHFLKVGTTIAVLVTLIYSRQYLIDRSMVTGGEFYALALFCLLGQFVMISAASTLTIYLGLELMSLSLYALVALRRDSLSSAEAAMKYFILGSLASGIMLYGISLIYGATGAIHLATIMQVLQSGEAQLSVLLLGLVFVVSGIAFKLGAVPFHMWVPDVYQGAPTAVALTIGSAPKLAALAMTLRVLIETLNDVAISWQPMLIIMAVLSLAIGNITALMQTNFKRLLGYSTISHIGFVLLGLLSGVDANGQVSSGAYGTALFYMVTYVLTTLASFGIILILSRAGFESEEIADFKGLNRRSPWLAFGVLILMFSLAGIPPLVGFYAKLAVLQATVNAGHIWLAVLAVLLSLIGAFYYLRVVKVMYFDEPAADAPALSAPMTFREGILSVNNLLIIVLGILPGGLMALCVQVIDASLKF